jgi:translocation and assembly module TamB
MSQVEPGPTPEKSSRAAARKKWRGRIGRIVAALVILALVAALAFPWFLGSGPARRWMLGRANRFLAPGGLAIEKFQFSWFGPTRMTRFAIIDPQGERVVDSPVAVWDRNLWQVLFEQPRLGTLTLEHGALDVERRADGSIDLAGALQALYATAPEASLTIHVVDGSLRLRSRGLGRPLVASKTDIVIVRRPAPEPMTWRANLESGSGPDSARLRVDGSYDRWGQAGSDGLNDLDVKLTGRDWPLDLEIAGFSIKAAYFGDLSVQHRDGAARIEGRGDFRTCDLSGPPLDGDHLKLPALSARWELDRNGENWSIANLDLSAADLGSLRSRGTVPPAPGRTGLIEGEVNLAGLAKQLPHALRLREGLSLKQGAATLRILAGDEAGRRAWDVEARISDLVAHNGDSSFTLRDPATLSARLVGDRSDLKLARFAIKTPFLTASGSGTIDEGISLTGTVDLNGLQTQLRDFVDFHRVNLAGKGPLTASYRRVDQSFDARLALDLRDLKLEGLGPVSVQREAAQLHSRMTGPIAESGFPGALTSARIKATSAAAETELVADWRDEGADLSLRARLPLAKAERSANVDARFTGRLDGQQLDVREVRIELAPSDENTTRPLRLSAKGRYDRATGALSLAPLEKPSGAVSLATDGIRVSGLGTSTWSVEAALVGDVAALMRAQALWSRTEPSNVSGEWSGHLSARSSESQTRVGGRIDARNLSIIEGPVSMALQATYRKSSDQLEVSELVVSSSYATLEASGRLDDMHGRQVADVRGSLTPDWKALNELLKSRIEPGAYLAGQPRPFFIKGPFSGEDNETVDVEAGFDLAEADIYGMKFGAAPIVIRRKGGQTAVDPIETTLNDGRIRLEPRVVAMKDKGSAVVLGPTSWISGAEINDEVSRRVLAFVAPVLEDATRVRGRISADLRHAEFPLVRDAGQKAIVEGDVVFRDVEFIPGPLAEGLLSLMNRRDTALRLDKPVRLAIANGKVETKGLALPVGNFTEIALEGSVGFDRELNLRATFPVTSSMLGNSLIGDIVEGTRITVPIGGTLSSPRIDRDAFRLGLKDTGKDLLQRGMTRGAFELLNRMARPRDPNAPPPPPRLTPRERRAIRRGEVPPPN